MTHPPKRLLAIASLALAGMGVSVSLTQHYYELRSGAAGFKSFCNLGSTMNCDVVAASPYAEFFAGLPLSSFAAGWYLAIFLLALIARNQFWRRETSRALIAFTGLGLLFSLGYLWIMVGVVKTYCLYCLGLDGIALLTFALALSLKPEGLASHKLDGAKWKSYAGIAGVSLLLSVVLLKSIETTALPASTIAEMSASTLSSPVLPVNVGPELPSIGPANAPITIVEFSDFQCPYCRLGAMTLHAVQQRYPTQVRVVFRNYPLDSGCNRSVPRPMHPYACEAARTVVCAHKQGRFEPVYETIFEHQTSLAPGKIEAWALEAGLDAQVLKTCMAAPETQTAIARDVEEGTQLGLEGTPLLFINGHKVNGVVPPPVWHHMIETLLKQQKSS